MDIGRLDKLDGNILKNKLKISVKCMVLCTSKKLHLYNTAHHVIPGVEDVLHSRYLACEPSSGPPEPGP